MLIESYLIEFSEIKKCIASMDCEDFIVLSENIFSLSERKSTQAADLLSDNTPSNHPEALLLVNKDFARNLILNDDAFNFLKSSHIIDNLNGVTLHLAFASIDLIQDLQAVSVKRNVDGVAVRCVGLEALLLAQQVPQKRYQDNLAIFKKSIAIYRKDMLAV